MDDFIKALLDGIITDDDLGYLVSAATVWRNSSDWLDVFPYTHGTYRWSAYGTSVEFVNGVVRGEIYT